MGTLALLLVVAGTLAVLAVVGRSTTPAPDRAPLRTLRTADLARETLRGWQRLADLQERNGPTPWT